MAVKFGIRFRDQDVGRRYSTRMAELSARTRRALTGALRDARDEILTRGRADIAGAGKFGPRWTQGLQGEVVDRGGDLSLDTTHDIPYFTTHQYGATIRGRPLLWIPLSFSDAVGKRARDYGPLFRVDREGKSPLLLSPKDGQPKYSGHESVTIPKRFHVVEIIRDVSRRLREFYRARLER